MAWTSCTTSKKIKSGELAYELKQYSLATELLSDEFENYSNESRKARIAFLLGKSYEQLLLYPEALQWYQKAAELQFGPEALKQSGLLLKMEEKYSQAVKIFESLASIPEFRSFADKEVFICREAARWKADPEPFIIKKSIESTGYSHYAPVLYRDQYLLVTSDRPEANGKDEYTWTGRKFSDFFLFTRDGQFLSSFDPAVNSPNNEGSACFTKDNNTMYFTRCQREGSGNDYCKIMRSKYAEGVWSDPEDLSFTLDKVQYGHPALLEEDSVLVFTTDLANPGGTYDLYYAEWLENGNWSTPYPMPKSINTEGNEKFPTAEQDTLYFSSDFLAGMGGYDIFKTYLRKDGTWAPPVNLKYPLNSGGDDFCFLPDRNGKKEPGILEQGYFSSSRSNLGVDEIFKYKRTGRKERPETKPEIKNPVAYYVGGRTYREKYEEDNPAKNRLDNEILPETRIQLLDEQGRVLEETRTGNSGVYAFKLDSGKIYMLKADKPYFLTTREDIHTIRLSVEEGQNTVTIQKDLVLPKIYYDQEVVLNNIYYKFDKWDLTSQAYPTLEKLATMMKENPLIIIQLNAHTDCQGEDDYNMELSQKRAQSVVTFLIQNGISPARLVPVGHGETKPAILCRCEDCTDAEHQKNRRTSFTILSKPN